MIVAAVFVRNKIWKRITDVLYLRRIFRLLLILFIAHILDISFRCELSTEK